MAEVLHEPLFLEAHSLHSGSISFGRFETEHLSWERRSSFSYNNHLEEVERYSKTGSVNQRKAYFEVFFKRKGLLQPPASLSQNWTECQVIEGKNADNSNYMELYRESLSECDEERLKYHGDYKVEESSVLYQPQADHITLPREDKPEADVKLKVKAETGGLHESSKLLANRQTPGNSSSPGLRKSQEVSLKAKAESKTSSSKLRIPVTTASSTFIAKVSTDLQKEELSMSHTVKQPVQNILTVKPSLSKTPKSMECQEVEKHKQQNSRPNKVERSSTERTTKPSATTINSSRNGSKEKNRNEGKEARIKPMPETDNSKTTRTPAISTRVPQDAGDKVAVPLHAETAKLGRKSSDPVRKVTEGMESLTSSTSSSIRQLSPQPSKRSRTLSKSRENILPTTCPPQGERVDTKKRDFSPSQTVSKSSKLAKVQSKSSSASPVCRAPSESSTSSSIKQLSSQYTSRTESPMKNNLPTKCLPGGKEVAAKKRDLDISQRVCKPSKLAKLQSKSSSQSPVRRAASASSTSSFIKQLSSRQTNRIESPMKNDLPRKCLPGENEDTAKKCELDISQTVCKPSKLLKLQSRSSSPSPVCRDPSEFSTSSSIEQISSRRTNRTESPMKNNSPTKRLPGGNEVAAKKHGLDISQTVCKPSTLAKLQSKSSGPSPSPSPVRRPPSESSTPSTIKQLSSQSTNRTESRMKNKLPMKCLLGGKEVAAKKHGLNISQTVCKPSKLAKLQSKSSSPGPSPVRRPPSESSTPSSFKQLSSQSTNRTESCMKNNLPMKCLLGGKEVAAKKRDSDISQTVSKSTKLAKVQSELSTPSLVLKAATAPSTSSSVGQFSPEPKKGNEVPRKNNEKKSPTRCPPEGKDVNAKKPHLDRSQSVSTKLAKLQRESSNPVRNTSSTSLASIGQHASQAMKRSEIPKKTRSEPKQLGTKGHNSKRESVSNKSTKLQGTSVRGSVGPTSRTNHIESVQGVQTAKPIKKSESPRRDRGTGTLKPAVMR